MVPHYGELHEEEVEGVEYEGVPSAESPRSRKTSRSATLSPESGASAAS